MTTADHMTQLWKQTLHDIDEQPGVICRAYLVHDDGTTGHAVIAGDSKNHCREMVLENLTVGESLVKMEKHKEGNINHPHLQ